MKNIVRLFAVFSLFLTACSSSPSSYLPASDRPIVNVEAVLAEQLKVIAEPLSLNVVNNVHQPLMIQYKLFWYDQYGVTQHSAGLTQTAWSFLRLEPKQKSEIPLVKPTEESTNYRVYLRQSR